MKFVILLAIIIFNFQSINCQIKRDLNIYLGPSLTNVQDITNGEKIFYASPQRPFYAIHFHLGAYLESPLFNRNDLRISYGLSYDQRGSAHTGFNKEKEAIYGFLGIPCLFLYRPLEKKKIDFEIGMNFLYLIYNPFYLGPTPFRNFQLDYSVGLRFNVWKNLRLGIRFMEPLIIMRGTSNVVPINPSFIEKTIYKTHSIQLSFNYQFKI